MIKVIEALAYALAALMQVVTRLWTAFAPGITRTPRVQPAPHSLGMHAVKMGRQTPKRSLMQWLSTASGVHDVLYPTAQFMASERKIIVDRALNSRFILFNRSNSRPAIGAAWKIPQVQPSQLDEHDALPKLRTAAFSTARSVTLVPRKRRLPPLEPLPQFAKRRSSRGDDFELETKTIVDVPKNAAAEEEVVIEVKAANEIEKNVQVRSPPPSVDIRSSQSPAQSHLPMTPPPSLLLLPSASSTMSSPSSFPDYSFRPAPGPTRIHRLKRSPLIASSQSQFVRSPQIDDRAAEIEKQLKPITKSPPTQALKARARRHLLTPAAPYTPIMINHSPPTVLPISTSSTSTPHSARSATSPSPRESLLAEEIGERIHEQDTDHLASQSPQIPRNESPTPESGDTGAIILLANGLSPWRSSSPSRARSPSPMSSPVNAASPLPQISPLLMASRSPTPLPSPVAFVMPLASSTPPLVSSPPLVVANVPVILPPLNPPTPPKDRLERRIDHELDKIEDDMLRIIRSRGIHHDVLDQQTKLKRQRTALRTIRENLTLMNIHLERLKAEKAFAQIRKIRPALHCILR